MRHFLDAFFVQMKDNAAAKQFDKRCEQGIAVKDLSCWYDRKIYQGWPERNENAAQPENKPNHMHHFQRGYFANVIQRLAKMQG
jgi:hypothetical protein